MTEIFIEKNQQSEKNLSHSFEISYLSRRVFFFRKRCKLSWENLKVILDHCPLFTLFGRLNLTSLQSDKSVYNTQDLYLEIANILKPF